MEQSIIDKKNSSNAFSKEQIDEIEHSIGYCFKEKRLLCNALTHISYLNEHSGAVSNERLEFLGDRVLNLVCAEDLFYNNAGDEGTLTELLKGRVSREPLKVAVNNMDVLKYIRASNGVSISTSSKATSDIFEAIVGAIYVDSGSLDACKAFIFSHLKQVSISDYISILKEWAEKEKLEIVKNSFQSKCEPNTFLFTLKIKDMEFEGKGTKIKLAERDACEKACKYFGIF